MENLTIHHIVQDFETIDNTHFKGFALNYLKDYKPELYKEYLLEQQKKKTIRAKDWRKNNLDKARETQKKYKQQTFICSCGKEVKQGHKADHMKRPIHIKLLKQKEESNKKTPLEESNNKNN